jgi:hypothetical protein
MKQLLLALLTMITIGTLMAQELSPRAYWPAPKGTQVAVIGYAYSWGYVLTDPSLPISGLDSRIHIGFAPYLQTLNLFGQDSTESIKNKHHFGRIGYQYGAVLKTNDFVRGNYLSGEPIDYYQSVRIEFGWQMTGSKMWHAIWNYPTFGLGFYAVDYNDEDQLGKPFALYGFTEWPFVRTKNLVFSLQVGFGLSFNWEPFDPLNNPYNEAIGTFKTIFIDVGVMLDYIISNHINIAAGPTITHFSNGGSKQPNLGLNQLGMMGMVKYKFQSEEPLYAKYDIPDYEKNNEWLISISWGLSNVHIDSPEGVPELVDKYLRVDHSVFTLTSTYYRQTTWKSKFGGGIDLFYDKSVGGQLDAGAGQVEDVDIPFEQKFRLGLFGAYEFVLHDLSFLLNIGYSIIQREDILPRLYQRVGFKYHFTENLFFGLSGRFQEYHKAIHLEFNVGYRFRWI